MFELTHTADLSHWSGDRKDPAWLSYVAGVRLFVERGAPDPAALSAVSGASTKPSPFIHATRRNADNNKRITVAVLATLIIAIIVGLAVPAVRYLRQTPPPETRVDIVTPATNQPAHFALSPDGRQMVFVASGDGASRLWLRSLATTTAQPLAGTEGATFPFWSPDSRSLGFFANGALKRLDLAGGAPQTLAPTNASGAGGTWNAEGVIVFAASITSPLLRVAANGGAVSAVTTVGMQQGGHLLPFFLPDGRRFLFTVFGGQNAQGVYLGALDGSAPTRLAPDISQAMYLPAGTVTAAGGDGWLLWGRANTLVAQQLDLDRKMLVGNLVTLADGMGAIAASYSGGWSVTATGLVAYRTGKISLRQLTWFDRSGKLLGTVGDPDDTLRNPRVSPDGRRVVVERTVEANTDLWLLDGARLSRLTFDPARELFPFWSPDGTRIVFRSQRTGAGDLYQTFTNGAGGDESLLAADQLLAPQSWSQDGRFLLYQMVDPQTASDLWVLPMEGDRTPWVFLKTAYRETYAAFSPDGRWVAYHSSASGRNEIYIRPFVPQALVQSGQWQVSTEGGISPTWRPDGKELYYLSPAGEMMAAPITVVGNTLEPGAPVVLFPTHVLNGGVDTQTGRQYDVAPDGRFLINTELDTASTTAPITLIQNWHPEVKQ